MPRTLRFKHAFGRPVEGEILVLDATFVPAESLDRTGAVRGGKADGACVKDKILVIPAVKDLSARGWNFAALVRAGLAPKAVVFGRLHPVLGNPIIEKALFAGIPVAEGWSAAAGEGPRSGDLARFDPAGRSLELPAGTAAAYPANL